MFQEERECVKAKPHSSRPSTLIDEQYVALIRNLVLSNHRLLIRNINGHVSLNNFKR